MNIKLENGNSRHFFVKRGFVVILLLIVTLSIIVTGCQYDFFNGGDLSVQVYFPTGLTMASYNGKLVITGTAEGSNPIESSLRINDSGDRGYLMTESLAAGEYSCKITLVDSTSNQTAAEGTYTVTVDSGGLTFINLQVVKDPGSGSGITLSNLGAAGGGAYNPAVRIDRMDVMLVKHIQSSTGTEISETILYAFGNYSFAAESEFQFPSGDTAGIGYNRALTDFYVWSEDDYQSMLIPGVPENGNYIARATDVNDVTVSASENWGENANTFSSPEWTSPPASVSVSTDTPINWILDNAFSIEKQILFIIPLEGQNGGVTSILPYDRNTLQYTVNIAETGWYTAMIAAVDFPVNHLMLSTDPAEYPDGLVYQIVLSMEDSQDIDFIGYDFFSFEVQ